ncbi:MAG: hypothetical protein RL065_763 [Bacteroidota bacterium]|jgi:predicted nucleotidyltransferase
MFFDENFIEFISLLNKNEVKYVLVGGLAVVLNGHSRTTGDMDIYYEREENNVLKILKTIKDFGFGGIGFTKEDLMDVNGIVQMGRPPLRIDLLCELPGVNFKEVFESAFKYEDSGVTMKVIHINHLINNKIAVGRDKDLSDAKALKKIIDRRKK